MREKTLRITFILLLLVFTTTGGIGVRTTSGSPLPVISLDPSTSTAEPGGYFTVNITVVGITASESLYGWEVTIRFNPDILETHRSNVTEGPFLENAVTPQGYDTWFLKSIDNSKGEVSAGATVTPKGAPDPPYPPVGAIGGGTLATIVFHAKAEGATLLHLEEGRHFLYTIVVTSVMKIAHEVIDGIFDNREPPFLSPVALFDADPPVAEVNQTIIFNASASYDPDAWLVSYEWDFGDGALINLTDPVTTHFYNQTGTYKVNLTVTDYDNLTNTATKNVTVLLPLGTIAGKVTDALTGYPIEGATVEAGSYSATSNETGYYKIDIAPGTYNVTALATGYVNETKTDVVVYFNLITNVNFTLAPVPSTGTLSISTTPVMGEVFVNVTSWGLAPQSRVVDVGTYNVSFAMVTGYYTPNWQLATVTEDAETTVTGAYTPITGNLTVDTSPVAGEVFVNETSWGVAPQSKVVQVGTYNVSFGDVGGYYTPTWQLATVYENLETIVEGVYESILGAIDGTITDASTGLPITGASITADGYSATTDGEGHYSIEVPPGTYSVTVSATKFVGQSETATVTSNTATTLDFALTPVNGTISGTVTDSSTGDPIAGATVTANGVSVSTGTDGTYSIEVPPGTYSVTASADGYESSTKTDITVVAEETTPVDFELTPIQPQNILLYAGVAAIAIIIVAAIAVYFLKVRKPT